MDHSTVTRGSAASLTEAARRNPASTLDMGVLYDETDALVPAAHVGASIEEGTRLLVGAAPSSVDMATARAVDVLLSREGTLDHDTPHLQQPHVDYMTMRANDTLETKHAEHAAVHAEIQNRIYARPDGPAHAFMGGRLFRRVRDRKSPARAVGGPWNWCYLGMHLCGFLTMGTLGVILIATAATTIEFEYEITIQDIERRPDGTLMSTNSSFSKQNIGWLLSFLFLFCALFQMLQACGVFFGRYERWMVKKRNWMRWWELSLVGSLGFLVIGVIALVRDFWILSYLFGTTFLLAHMGDFIEAYDFNATSLVFDLGKRIPGVNLLPFKAKLDLGSILTPPGTRWSLDKLKIVLFMLLVLGWNASVVYTHFTDARLALEDDMPAFVWAVMILFGFFYCNVALVLVLSLTFAKLPYLWFNFGFWASYMSGVLLLGAIVWGSGTAEELPNIS